MSGYRCSSNCRSRGREFFPARSHTFVEIDHEIISTVILLPSTESFKKSCCQLQAKVCARSTGQLLVQACSRKSVVRWTDHPTMTIAIDLGRKAAKQTQKKPYQSDFILANSADTDEMFTYGAFHLSLWSLLFSKVPVYWYLR